MPHKHIESKFSRTSIVACVPPTLLISHPVVTSTEEEEVLKVLSVLSGTSLFGISVLTRKTKNLVESLKLTASYIEVKVTDCFRVHVYVDHYSPLFFKLYQVLENEPPKELRTPADVRLHHEGKWVAWVSPMSVNELLGHLQLILHNSEAALSFQENCDRFSLESIHNYIKYFKSVGFSSGNQEHNRKILSLFQPASITLFGQALVGLRAPADILILNVDTVHVFRVQIKLDDLLMTNSHIILFSCPRLSMKTLNRFLKLWTQGSNPRLEWVYLRFHSILRLEEQFNGLPYKHAPPHRLRFFKASDGKTHESVLGGWDIWKIDVFSRIGISLLSQKTKNLVESLKMKTYTLQVAVSDRFEFYMLFPNWALLTLQLYYARENRPPKEIDTPPENIYSVDEMFRVKWANSMSVTQLLEHLRFIFHKSKVTLTFGTDSERFSVESLHRNVKDIESISFFNRNNEQHRRILYMFQPASLTLDSSAIFHHVPNDILIQNFDLIRVPSMQNTLDSLLMTNARSVQTSGGRQSAKLLNTFLKLWVRGSNPRLEFLLFRFRNATFQTEELLEGLSYTNVPLERVRLFKCSDKKEAKRVSGGCDIRRFDGTKATIKVSTRFSAVEFELFRISLLSKKTKNSVKSLEMTATYFQVDVTDCFQVYLRVNNYSPMMFRLYRVLENEPLQEIGTPRNVRLLHERRWIIWRNSMSVKELIDHLQFVFHSSGASLFFKENSERFSLESVHKNVKDITDIGFLSGNHEHNRMVLSLFQPANITLFAQALVNFRVPRYILIQNFDVVHVFAVQTTLDDLLMTNVRFINLQSRVSMETLNQFLKLWTQGSNPRLECLFLEFHGDLQLEELFSGLKYQNASNGVTRFKTFGVKTPVEIPNGRAIWRLDGTKATILVSIEGSNPRLERVHLRFTGNPQTEELLSGLKYQDASRNTGKLFKSSGNIETKNVVGGWDIWRFDGTKATITVEGNVLQIFGISILSKKTKSLVESVKLKHRRVEIDITDSFKITIFFSDHTVLVFQLYQVQENAPLQELETPETYHIQCGITTVTWKNSMSVKELLEHLRLIFHSSIDPLFFKENCERFSLESIHKNVTDVRMVAISSENREHNKKILNLFQPDSLEIGGQALGRVPRDVLIQNFDQIRVSSGQTTLDDLLMTNSRLIHLSCRGLSWKILNKFLRLWTTGCNSRLEFLFVEFDGSSRFNDLFDGLKFQAAPSGRVRSFKNLMVHRQRLQLIEFLKLLHAFTWLSGTIIALFGVSLLSKKTKSLVESLKLTTRRFIVSISDTIRIQLLFPIDGRDHLYLELSQFEENYSSEGLGTPGNVHCDFENTSVAWRNSMSAKQLLDHLLFIFHGSITSLYFYSNCVRFSLDSVHKYVKDVKSIHILSRNREHTRKILSLFHPAEFDINYSTLIDRVPGDVLIQNLDHIRVLHAQITLNDLLITNARSIRFEHFKISARILNKFLKMFVKGSNQRLEFMLLVFRHTAIQPAELLSGLKYENTPHGIWRCFKTVDERKIWDVAEGFGVSILSNKAKNLVESFKITAEMLKVEVTDMFEINFIFPSDTTFHFELYQVSENQSLQEHATHKNIESDRSGNHKDITDQLPIFWLSKIKNLNLFRLHLFIMNYQIIIINMMFVPVIFENNRIFYDIFDFIT
ncbi:unnamed protein product [Caenorhabditis brenneri]